MFILPVLIQSSFKSTLDVPKAHNKLLDVLISSNVKPPNITTELVKKKNTFISPGQ